MIGHGINIWGQSGVGAGGLLCSRTIATPVDSADTIQSYETVCSSGAIEVDSIAAGAGVVTVNGIWRLT